MHDGYSVRLNTIRDRLLIAMADFDDHPCPVDDCDEAYPHSLLLDKHIVDDHPEWIEEVLDGGVDAGQ